MAEWVVKVGGSLFDWPELAAALTDWLTETTGGSVGVGRGQRVLLLAGGGALADAVRQLDRLHGLSQEQAHWLALRALQTTGQFLAELLGGLPIIADPSDLTTCTGETAARDPDRVDDQLDDQQTITAATQARPWAVVDAYAFALADEQRAGALPHTWDTTTDAIAAQLAVRTGARRLVLLKSADWPVGCDVVQASRVGFVDAQLPAVLAAAGGALMCESVNLRAWALARSGRSASSQAEAASASQSRLAHHTQPSTAL